MLIGFPTACNIDAQHEARIVLTLDVQQHCHMHTVALHLPCRLIRVYVTSSRTSANEQACQATSPQQNPGSDLSQLKR